MATEEAAHAEKIVGELRGDIIKFYELSKGSIEAIGLLFSEMAKQPLPPQVICQILGLDEETVKAAFEAGNPPVATQEQLIDAVQKSVDLEDTVDMYKPIFSRHIKRFQNAEEVMRELGPQMTEFHKKVGGNVDSIAAFFLDLAPEASRAQGMPPGMINALLRIDPSAKTCQAEDFLGCFERNLDLSDTVAVIRPVLDRHSK
uniref:Uncharacterized protein n=2 Tax=Hemiselmis andersenii TaxID=464988 RepID=A0A6U5AR90_HEMAN|mmetsp:Transcript_50122/g.121697  ORF Transcript_50122/g.121697 Transcript_50122/m.121697 type:complete len:202 (+) Transcript_50122:52-657(+)